MIHVTDTAHPPGTIIVPTGAQPRFYEFQESLDQVFAPVGTKLIVQRSCDIAQNLNKGLRRLTGEWAWFLGDDHCFDKHFLMRLLDRRVDVVVPIAPCKTAPWMPCIMHGPDKELHGDAIWHENMLLYHWDELSDGGLMPLPQGDFIGQAGMLVRKPVLDTLGDPWFKCGQLDPGRLQEDMTFCRDLQQRGFTVYVDTDEIFDHYFIIGITAKKHQGKYVPALRSGPQTLVLPDVSPEIKVRSHYNGHERVKWVPYEPIQNEARYLERLERKVGPFLHD